LVASQILLGSLVHVKHFECTILYLDAIKQAMGSFVTFTFSTKFLCIHVQISQFYVAKYK
jgi:hypothetical protein